MAHLLFPSKTNDKNIPTSRRAFIIFYFEHEVRDETKFGGLNHHFPTALKKRNFVSLSNIVRTALELKLFIMRTDSFHIRLQTQSIKIKYIYRSLFEKSKQSHRDGSSKSTHSLIFLKKFFVIYYLKNRVRHPVRLLHDPLEIKKNG